MKLVAFLDILGFKNLVNNNSFKELKSIYKIFERSYQHSVSFDKYRKTPDGITSDFRDCHIEAIQISDSIIIWSKSNSIRSYYDLIIIVRKLLGHGIFSGLPLRACIDYGEIEHTIKTHSENISTNTFFGKAITTSYINCENQSWSGGYITKEAIEAYSKVNSNENDLIIKGLTNLYNLEDRLIIKKYPVPIKEGIEKDEFCINWVNWTNPKLCRNSIETSFNKFKKESNNHRIKTIIENTIKFWESCPERVK